MTVLADASAIVKLFARESGSDRMWAEPGPFALSALTRVEVASALWQKSRNDSLGTEALSPADAALLVSSLRIQLSDGAFHTGAAVSEVPVSEVSLEMAMRICGIHALRAGDAIQLATALTVREVDPTCTRFWVFDARLARAAAGEGFTVLGID